MRARLEARDGTSVRLLSADCFHSLVCCSHDDARTLRSSPPRARRAARLSDTRAGGHASWLAAGAPLRVRRCCDARTSLVASRLAACFGAAPAAARAHDSPPHALRCTRHAARGVLVSNGRRPPSAVDSRQAQPRRHAAGRQRNAHAAARNAQPEEPRRRRRVGAPACCVGCACGHVCGNCAAAGRCGSTPHARVQPASACCDLARAQRASSAR